MNLTPVISGNVKAVGYNPSTKTLRVQFSSGTYDYFDVPPEKWEGLQNCINQKMSIGGFISANIVKQHRFLRDPDGKHGS